MTNFNDESRMPFGKHKGVKLKDVPAGYLCWLYGEMEGKKDWQGPLFTYLKDNLKVLEKEAEEEANGETYGDYFD